ncbi:MAG: DUF2202 domain-containing protein [Bryobacteraceae bacterium]|nr:DUF2202 domain-containing protein [Bryobacteraceae bacterium]
MSVRRFNANAIRTAMAVVLLIGFVAIPAAAQGFGAPAGVGKFGPPSTAPGMGGQGTGTCLTCTATATPLGAEQVEQLKFMREEEKLARDVYTYLFKKYGLRVFDRISESEQRHFDTLGRLLTANGIADPAKDKAEGEFVNTDLQKLYTDLIAKGDVSVKDALEVGVLVEKTDIADLEKILETETNTTLKRVYLNLLNGSMSHLDAFEGYLEIYGA